MAPEVARLGHVSLETPNLEDSLSFFHDAVGLEIVERIDETVFLRAVDERDHHSLSLTAGDTARIDHIGWQTAEPEDVAAFAQRFEEQGMDITWIDEETEPGQGEAIRFEIPNGHRFELYGTMEKPEPPAERRSKLQKPGYHPSRKNPVAPPKSDHAQIWDPPARACPEGYPGALGSQGEEDYDEGAGSRGGT